MIEIRLSPIEEHDHDPQIRDLLLKTSTPGSFSYHYERSGGYAHFAKTQGSHYQLWKAVENESLLGMTQITYDRVSWNGSTFQICYSGDTRVSPLARGKKVSDSLIQSACSQPYPVFGAVMGSNSMVLGKKLADWRKRGVDFREIGEIKALFYRPKSFRFGRSTLSCRTAKKSDLEPMFHLWKEYGRTRNLVRHYEDLTTFESVYLGNLGISLEHTLLIFENETLIAMMSLWNQSNIRKMIVDHEAPWVKWISKFIHLPKEGKEMELIYGFQHAFLPNHKRIREAIELLIKKSREFSRKEKAHFFVLGLDPADDQYLSFQKPSFFSNTIKLILDSRGHHEFETSQLPFHVEVGLG